MVAGFLFEAVTTRLELATSGVTGRHSNQLNYVTGFCPAKLHVFFVFQKQILQKHFNKSLLLTAID